MNEQVQVSEESLELSKMFHEIKNPLALINSSLQLIESDHPEVKTFRFWNQTMKDLQGLRELINELSNFQKGSILTKTKINLFDFTEDLLDATEAFFLERDIPFLLENEIDDFDFIADDGKLRQALINLLKNAAESSDAGSPVKLHTRVTSDSLVFSIRDHGRGIPEFVGTFSYHKTLWYRAWSAHCQANHRRSPWEFHFPFCMWGRHHCRGHSPN